MKKFIALAAISAACSTSAFAQVSNFTGPSAGVNASMVSATTKITFDDSEIDGVGKQSFGAALQAAYGIELSKDSVVSFGGTYGLNKNKVGSFTDSEGIFSLEAKNQMSLYVEPGFLINNSTLAYGKVSHESAKFTAIADGSLSRTVKGTGIGFGLRTMIDKNLSLQAEIKQIKYGTETVGDTKFKAGATVGTIGLGYKF